MLVLSPTYRNAIKDSGLDPETFPISQDAGWESSIITFDGELTNITFSDVDFSAVSNVNVDLNASLETMPSFSANTSNTKQSAANIKSDSSNSATLQVKESILNNLVKTATMDLQVAQYTNTITSDTGTDLHASKTAHGASIESDVATTLETRAKEKKTTLRTKTADASITTTSHVITLR